MGIPPSFDEAVVLNRLRTARAVERDALFEEIFRAHRGRVFAICARLCGRRGLTDDAVQETFLEVFRSLSAFRGEAQLGTWIYRVALRTALRLRAREKEAPSDAEREVAAVDPHPALAARADAVTLQRALDELPAEQRTVMALFAADGLTYGEIARILGVPEGTVWSRLHHARRSLAAALERPMG